MVTEKLKKKQVVTKAHRWLARDYHGLKGVVKGARRSLEAWGNMRPQKTDMYFVEFHGPEWDKRNAANQSGNRMCIGLWMCKEMFALNP